MLKVESLAFGFPGRFEIEGIEQRGEVFVQEAVPAGGHIHNQGNRRDEAALVEGIAGLIAGRLGAGFVRSVSIGFLSSIIRVRGRFRRRLIARGRLGHPGDLFRTASWLLSPDGRTSQQQTGQQ